MSLKLEQLKGLKFIELEKGTPSFTWQGNTYPFNPSITDFNRQLETGGFQLIKLMTATVRKFDVSNEDESLIPLFTSGYPSPQQIIVYSDVNGQSINYRIESIKQSSVGAYFRIIAHSTSKGA
jgi:hypothetical protein